jgi:hypothetical protein
MPRFGKLFGTQVTAARLYSMPQPSPLQSAQFYKDEAARLRWQAEITTHEMLRRQLLRVATDYEELAETVDMLNLQDAD